ncbi:MAG: 50S ribosomal protein L9 [Deltaproteobacteria bacterium]|nr:50S ribosomal protein L9 [Deltaproteobacteria bacterium]
MKVILRADVENLGRLGDLVSVKAGYGRNFLLPQGLAMLASPANIKVFELERKKLQAKMDAMRAAAGDLAGLIESASVTIAMRVGENDKLYGSVTSIMIADYLAEKGIEVDRHRILLDSPIRTLGEFEVRVRLHAGVNATLKVKVVPEERIHEENARTAEPPSAAADAPQNVEPAAQTAAE